MIPSLDAAPGGVASLTGDLRILATNQLLQELVGRDVADLAGQPFDSLLTTPSRILFQTHVYPALASDGRVEEIFLTLASPDGTPTPILLNVVRHPSEESVGSTNGIATSTVTPTYLALFMRISARARWQTDLLAATRAIEHELRRITDDRDRSIQTQQELTEANQRLQQTLDGLHAAAQEVRRLREIVPLCAWCRRIRVDGPGEPEWLTTEQFLGRDQVAVTHGMCDDCMAEQEGELARAERGDLG